MLLTGVRKPYLQKGKYGKTESGKDISLEVKHNRDREPICNGYQS